MISRELQHSWWLVWKGLGRAVLWIESQGSLKVIRFLLIELKYFVSVLVFIKKHRCYFRLHLDVLMNWTAVFNFTMWRWSNCNYLRIFHVEELVLKLHCTYLLSWECWTRKVCNTSWSVPPHFHPTPQSPTMPLHTHAQLTYMDYALFNS